MAPEMQAEDVLFKRFRAIYPKFERPDDWEIATWRQVLRGHSHDELKAAFVLYRRSKPYNSPPTPAEFEECLNCSRPSESSAAAAPKHTMPDRFYQVSEGLEYHDFRAFMTGKKIGGSCVMTRDFDKAIKLMLEDLPAMVPSEELKDLLFAEKLRLAVANCLWDKFYDYLERAVKVRIGINLLAAG